MAEKYSTRKLGRYTVIDASGELGFSESQVLKGEVLKLIEKRAKNLIVNLSPVTLLGSIGLSVIIKLWDITVTGGGDFRVICSNAHIRDVFAVTGTDRKIPIYIQESDLVKDVKV